MNHRLGWAEGEHNLVFYVDGIHIAGHNPIWVHMILTAVVKCFERVGLQTNLGKAKVIVCTLEFI